MLGGKLRGYTVLVEDDKPTPYWIAKFKKAEGEMAGKNVLYDPISSLSPADGNSNSWTRELIEAQGLQEHTIRH
jgi:hypothetical protein